MCSEKFEKKVLIFSGCVDSRVCLQTWHKSSTQRSRSIQLMFLRNSLPIQIMQKKASKLSAVVFLLCFLGRLRVLCSSEPSSPHAHCRHFPELFAKADPRLPAPRQLFACLSLFCCCSFFRLESHGSEVHRRWKSQRTLGWNWSLCQSL